MTMDEIVTTDQMPVMAPPPATTMLQVIERAAMNPDVDIDKMERLLAMKERMDSKEAETAFNEAMTQAQSETGRISADATNPQTRSNYATYAKLDKVLRPIYTRHGFSLSFSQSPGEHTDGHSRFICIVALRGFSRQYQIDMPNDGKGAKGNDVMTKTHAQGAAASYAMRYLLKLIFNVAIGEEDSDGNDPADEGVVPAGKVDPKDHGETLTAAQIRYVGEFVNDFRKALTDDVDEDIRTARIQDLRNQVNEDHLVYIEVSKVLTAAERKAIKTYVAMKVNN